MRESFDIDGPIDNETVPKHAFDIEDPTDNASLRTPKRSPLRFQIISCSLLLCISTVVVYFVFLRESPSDADGVLRTLPMITGHSTELSYRILELTNGLKVVLCSKKDLDETHITLCTGAGILDETPKQIGLANVVASAIYEGVWDDEEENDDDEDALLIEETWHSVHDAHSCFSVSASGTRVSEDEDDEDKDDDEETEEDELIELLDRFSDMFISPEFTTDALKAVLSDESTFEGTFDDEVGRVSRVVLSEDVHTLHPVHYTSRVRPRFDSSKFQGTPEELLQAVKEFHKEHYVPNDMSLVVASSVSLDELQDLVGSRFSKIRANSKSNEAAAVRKRLGPARYGNRTVFKDRAFEGFVNIYDAHVDADAEEGGDTLVRFVWRLPEWHGYVWKKKPWLYPEWALSWSGPGSILWQLEKNDWANGIFVGIDEDDAAFQFFYVEIELSDEGAEHIQEIGNIVFAYLKLLRDNPTDWAMDEMKQRELLLAHVEEIDDPLEDYILDLARHLLQYPPEYAIFGPRVILEVDNIAAQETLSHLSLESVRVELISNAEDFAAKCDKVLEVLRCRGDELNCKGDEIVWDSIRYKHAEIETDMLACWNHASHGLPCNGTYMEGVLRLPSQNPFVVDPKSLEMVTTSHPSSKPQLISGGDMPRIFHQAFVEGTPLYFHIVLRIYSQALAGDVHNVIWKLWSTALEEEVWEQLDDALELGISIDCDELNGALKVHVRMYGSTAGMLLKKLAEIMLDTVAIPPSLKINRIKKLKEKSQFALPEELAQQKIDEAVSSLTIPWEKELSILEGITEADLSVDPKKLFQSYFIEAFVMGNVLADDAKSYVNAFASAVQAGQGESMVHIQPAFQEALLSEKPTLLKLDGVHKNERSHVIHAYLQVHNKPTAEDSAFVDLLCQFLHLQKHIFTKHRLPAMTIVCPQSHRQVRGFHFTLRTEREPLKTMQLMHHELNGALDRAVKHDAEDFERWKQRLRNTMMDKPLLANKFQDRLQEFELRWFTFNWKEQLRAGLTALDVERFRMLAKELHLSKKRWLYVVVNKTAEVQDDPDLTDMDMEAVGIKSYVDVEFETLDRDAFRSSAEWKDVLDHDLKKPYSTYK